VILQSGNTISSSGNGKKSRSSSASSTSGSTLSVYSLEDSPPPSQAPKQTQENYCFGGFEKYKPLDLPPNFDLLSFFGKKVDKALKTDYKQPGSLPRDLSKKFVNQVADHIESENPRPSKQTIEWLAWRYCLKYPCLQQINPLQLMPGEKPYNSKPFKEWVGVIFQAILLSNKHYLQIILFSCHRIVASLWQVFVNLICKF